MMLTETELSEIKERQDRARALVEEFESIDLLIAYQCCLLEDVLKAQKRAALRAMAPSRVNIGPG